MYVYMCTICMYVCKCMCVFVYYSTLMYTIMYCSIQGIVFFDVLFKTYANVSLSHRLLGTLGSQKNSGAPGTLTTLPAVRNDLVLGSGASFSGRGLHLGKTWRERCSWRCAAIGLILLCATLAALLAYFAGEFWTFSPSGIWRQMV